MKKEVKWYSDGTSDVVYSVCCENCKNWKTTEHRIGFTSFCNQLQVPPHCNYQESLRVKLDKIFNRI